MMIMRGHSQCWGNKAIPASFSRDCRRPARRARGYKVEAASYALFAGALEAKRAKWLTRRLNLRTPTIPLPAQNMAAIKLLESWLNTPSMRSDEGWEEFKQTVDKYRSTGRKIFT